MPYLKSILTEGFLPSYCLENFDTFKFLSGGRLPGSFEMAVPMVCFCDIPLSKVKAHMTQYGHYGIGLKKDWGLTSGIAPLIYASKDSATTRVIDSSLKYCLSHPDFIRDAGIFSQFNNLLRLVRFSKPYQGPFFRRGKYLKVPVTFYNEREWRYVPEIVLSSGLAKPPDLSWLEEAIPEILSSVKDNKKRLDLEFKLNQLLRVPIRPWMESEIFNILRGKKDNLGTRLIHKMNQMLRSSYPLLFGIEHINYVLVKDEAEIGPLFKYLRKSKYYTEIEIERLISKTLTKRQIFEDF